MSSHDRGRRGVRPTAPPSPRDPSRWHKLWVVPASGEHWATALGDRVVWVWRHYLHYKGRFELCLESVGLRCLLCDSHTGREHSGYLPVLLLREQRTMVVSAGAWLHSPSLRGMDGRLRGCEVYATRLHARHNGPLRIWLPGHSKDGRSLPAAWDVLAELDVRYGLAARHGGVEAPENPDQLTAGGA